MRFALIGQPNCGKSTLFNQVAGYKAETGNFSGTSVTFTESKVRVAGNVITLVDLPGTYTLVGTNPAEREVFRYLAAQELDVIINVVDATHLAYGLELTLELLELHRPLVIAVNMMDEALRTGMRIDGHDLQARLGVPVLPLVASRGQGVRALFLAALDAARSAKTPQRLTYSPEIEQSITALAANIPAGFSPIHPEAYAVKLLEGDKDLLAQVAGIQPALAEQANLLRKGLEMARAQEGIWILSSERHGSADRLAVSVLKQSVRKLTWRDRLDDVLLHPVLGYLALAVILYIFFQIVYTVGSLTERPLLSLFDWMQSWLTGLFGAPGILSYVLVGLLQGVSGGVAIVLPYLLPFLLGLGVLEDIGYLPRVAFMMDALMHRIGLHGKAIVPFILGYGCNVPAVMSTRILEERRERFIAAALATLVPCAARLSVVFGLVAFYLGPTLALLIYLFNLLVISFTAKVLSRLLPEDAPGLILEMPVYRTPTIKSVFSKAWFRIREFVVEAWPVLIGGSVVLALLNYWKIAPVFNLLVRPLSWLLGLPGEVGVPLIFGILRKELSLVMLRQALGGADFAAVLSPVQMVTFCVFVVFYIPCLATLVVIRRELGTKAMLAIAAMTVVVATSAALLARAAALAYFG
jgi:ferrous iron transport protein B